MEFSLRHTGLEGGARAGVRELRGVQAGRSGAGLSWAIADIISRAGFPDGVFNLVMGRGSVVGEVIVNDPRVDAISFTGSVETGRNIAADGRGADEEAAVEMGGKNPLVVMDDADRPPPWKSP